MCAFSKRFVRHALFLLTASTAVGCNMVPHNLQPHRLWMLNRGKAGGTPNPYFSVQDRIRQPAGGEVNGPPEVQLGSEAPIEEALQ